MIPQGSLASPQIEEWLRAGTLEPGDQCLQMALTFQLCDSHHVSYPLCTSASLSVLW